MEKFFALILPAMDLTSVLTPSKRTANLILDPSLSAIIFASSTESISKR